MSLESKKVVMAAYSDIRNNKILSWIKNPGDSITFPIGDVDVEVILTSFGFKVVRPADANLNIAITSNVKIGPNTIWSATLGSSVRLTGLENNNELCVILEQAKGPENF